MSWQATAAVDKHCGADLYEYAALMALANISDKHGFVIIGGGQARRSRQLAQSARQSRSKFYDTVKALIGKGQLVRFSSPTQDEPAEYRITLPGLETPEEEGQGEFLGPDGKPLFPRAESAPEAGSAEEKDQENQGVHSTDTPLEGGENAKEGVRRDGQGCPQGRTGVSTCADTKEDLSDLLETPLPPLGDAGDPPAPPDGGRTPAQQIRSGGASQTGKGDRPPEAADAHSASSSGVGLEKPDPPELARLKAALMARHGAAKFQSWFAGLRLEGCVHPRSGGASLTGKRDGAPDREGDQSETCARSGAAGAETRSGENSAGSLDAKTITLSLPGQAVCDMVDNRYLPSIRDAWNAVNGGASSAPAKIRLIARKPELKPRYSIEEGEDSSVQKPKRNRRKRAA